jgi:hypothetical protein
MQFRKLTSSVEADKKKIYTMNGMQQDPEQYTQVT